MQLANKPIKRSTRRTDAQQQRDLEEDDNKPGEPVVMRSAEATAVGRSAGTNRQITEKMMITALKVKMLAIPSARHRIIERIPVLEPR